MNVLYIKESFNTGNNNNMFKFMLTILSAVAEMECELTVGGTREGMVKAKRYDTRSGRSVGLTSREIPASFKKYYPMWKDGKLTSTDFAKVVGVSRPTLYKYIKEYEIT